MNFRYPKTIFWISEINLFLDIKNTYFRYPLWLFRTSEKWLIVYSACHSFCLLIGQCAARPSIASCRIHSMIATRRLLRQPARCCLRSFVLYDICLLSCNSHSYRHEAFNIDEQIALDHVILFPRWQHPAMGVGRHLLFLAPIFFSLLQLWFSNYCCFWSNNVFLIFIFSSVVLLWTHLTIYNYAYYSTWRV